MAGLELCSGVFYYFISYYETSKREEVYVNNKDLCATFKFLPPNLYEVLCTETASLYC